jgi:hypothetical protein
MDPELVALAGTAATTVVTLLATDGWEKAKQAIGTLWRRARPERAEWIEDAVSGSREDLLVARDRGDDTVERELIAQWDSQIRRLLAADPDAAVLLAELVERELKPALAATTAPQSITTTVQASAQHGMSIAIGRDNTGTIDQKM